MMQATMTMSAAQQLVESAQEAARLDRVEAYEAGMRAGTTRGFIAGVISSTMFVGLVTTVAWTVTR